MPKIVESEDAVAAKLEIKNEATKGATPVKDNPKVNIADPAKPPELEIPESTKAEMDAGKKAIEEAEKARKEAEKAEEKSRKTTKDDT